MNTFENEVSQLKDNNLHQRKRIIELMGSLMKDLSEMGSTVDVAEFKVMRGSRNSVVGGYNNVFILYAILLPHIFVH